MVLFVRDVLVLSGVPPVRAAYDWIHVTVAVKFATVPLLQKLCEAVPVGAAGTEFTVIVAVAELEPPEFVAVN